MRGDAPTGRADGAWARRFGFDPSLLRRPGLHFVDPPHPEMCFVLSLEHATLVVTPPSFRERIAQLSRDELLDPERLRPLLPPGPGTLVGPAFVGYATEFPEPSADLERFASSGVTAFDALRAAMAPLEWSHANLESAAPPIYAVLRDGSVVAAAGAETLPGGVAHIGVATHPRHRGEGHARTVVAASAFSATQTGLLAQYQTLHANRAAMSVARRLGFERYATTLSARWGSAAS